MRGQASVVRKAVAQFALLAIVALLVLTVLVETLSNRLAHREAMRGAEVRSRVIAHGVAAPLVDGGVRAGLAPSLDRLGSALLNRIRAGFVTHIIVWDEQSQVLWSDQSVLIGDSLELPSSAATLFGSQQSRTLGPGDHPPHPPGAFTATPLFVVYVGARDVNGDPFVFEAHFAREQLDKEAAAILGDLLPLALAALLAFQLAVLPMAYSLARKVERAHSQRSTILARSLAAWHYERRRLAQDLHDTVIQDLSAASYALPSVAAQLPDVESTRVARETAGRIGAILEQSLQYIRTMLTELLPAELSGDGLVAAIEHLALQAQERGVEVAIDVSPELDLQDAEAGLVYRVVREGLANVGRHSEARHASVQVRTRHGYIEVLVNDDGRGLTEVEPLEGHFGLRLLRDMCADVGGESELVDRPEGGASLRVLLPAARGD